MALRQEREHPPGHRPALEAAPRMARIRERERVTRMALRQERERPPGHRPALEAARRMARIRERERVTRMALRQERERPPVRIRALGVATRMGQRTVRGYGHQTIRIRALVAATRMARIRERVLETRMALEAAIGQVGATTVPTIRGSGLNLRGEAGRLQPGTAMPFAPAPTAG
jgi:hypothetical protein